MSMSTHTVQGRITSFIFRNPENGFVVAEFELENKERIKIKGTIPSATPGIAYSLVGAVQTDKFGETFVVDSYDTEHPVSTEAIQAYLQTLEGCGRLTARKIVKEFGEKSLEVVEKEPKKIAALPKVGKNRSLSIQASLLARKSAQNSEVGLRTLLKGTPDHVIGKALARWESAAVELITEDPYRLTLLPQVGFETADFVARTRLGMELDNPRRLLAGCRYVAMELRQAGHTVFSYQSFCNTAATKLGLSSGDAIAEWLVSPPAEEIWKVWPGTDGCQLLMDWSAEMEVAGWIKSRLDFGAGIIEAGEINRTALADDQTKAMLEAVSVLSVGGLFILTGPPGTGKTYLVNRLIQHFEARSKSIIQMAPTGKAAQRMREMTGRPATTIHRGLEAKWGTTGFYFERDEANPLPQDLVIIDEVSMVDLHLFRSLAKAITGDTAVLLVGDHNQLPSVGPGCVLRDLLKAEVPAAYLTEIKRQDPGSIVQTCHAMVHRQPPPFELFNKTDLWLVPVASADAIAGQLVELAHERLPKWLLANTAGTDPNRDIQILSPRRTKHLLGTDALNPILRENLIKRGIVKFNENFRFSPGDRVIQTVNDYELGLFNGDTGTILGVTQEAKAWLYNLELDTGEKVAVSTRSNNLELAYALTIHKSQGSEWPVVILPVHSTFSFNFDRPLLYTAISRASKMCVIVGRFRDFSGIAQKPGSVTRWTDLEGKLRYMMNQR